MGHTINPMIGTPDSIAMVVIFGAVILGVGAMLFLAALKDGESERHHRWLRRQP